MKNFIPISNDFIYSTAILKLISEHGIAALAFYFMALGLMGLNGGWHRKVQLLRLRCPGLRMQTIEEILLTSELFELTDDDVVLLAEIEHNGLADYRQTIFYRCRTEKPWLLARTRSGAQDRARDRAPDRARDRAQDRALDGVCAGPINEEDIEKELETEKKKARWLALFFQSHCPHLLEMEEPMTVEQFDDLVKRFGLEEVKSVLTDMENELDLNKRSCAHTAESWLKGRARRNKTKNNSL